MGHHVGDVMPPSCTLFLAPPPLQMGCGGSGAPFPWGTRFVRAPSLQTGSPMNEGWGLHMSPLLHVSPPFPPSLLLPPSTLTVACMQIRGIRVGGACTVKGHGAGDAHKQRVMRAPLLHLQPLPQLCTNLGGHGGVRCRPFPFPHMPPFLGCPPPPHAPLTAHPWCMDRRGTHKRGRGGPSTCPPHPCTRGGW
jgi:hypothetical protein